MADIWPRLRKMLAVADVGEGKRKKPSSKNPYASLGLEKFATLLEELQSKQQPASLVERTTSSLSAARCISRSAQEWTASTLVRNASRRSDTTTGTTGTKGTKPSHCAPVAARPTDAPTVAITVATRTGFPQGCESRQSEDVSTSAPLRGVRLLSTPRCRAMKAISPGSFVHCQSAFVVLFALGAFVSSRVGATVETSKPTVAAIVTCSAVIRIWRNLGMVSARFMFSSLTLYFFTPLRSYLSRLSLVPSHHDPPIREESRNAENVGLQSAIPVAGESTAVLLPLLLPIPDLSSGTPESRIPTLFVTTTKTAAVSPARRLVKKFSSRLKQLGNLFKSSNLNITSKSSSSSSCHPSNNIAEAQPRKDQKIMRRQKSAETRSCSKKVRLGRTLSSQTLEQYNNHNNNNSNSLAAHSASSLSSPTGVDPTSVDPVAWPVVGLLVTLLFLLVGRVPAIMATSLFFVVVSPHSRARGRRENRAWQAARKLHRNPPPRGGRRWAGSSPRSRF